MDLKALLIDRFGLDPNVAHAEPVLHAAGVADRCRVVGGSFFDAVPDGGHAYVLKNTLFNWDDDQATAILRTCRRAMGPTGTLLVVDPVLAGPNEGEQVKFIDINMLVVATGQVRTSEEYAALFARAERNRTQDGEVVGQLSQSSRPHS